jgi:hypothetical protein
VFRTSDTVLIAVMVAAAAFTYKTKHDAEDKYAEARKLESAIRYEEDSIDVLKADWSLLTQPARLQRLAEGFAEQLKLQPVDPHQIVELKDLPDKQKELEVEDLLAGEVAAGQTKDKIVTGSVSQ